MSFTLDNHRHSVIMRLIFIIRNKGLYSMKRIFKRFFQFVVLFFVFLPLVASAFVVHNIQFQGLERIRTSTALSYIPIHSGQQYTTKRGDEAVRALYKTGFFSEVNIYRRGNTLVIRVSERPTIGLIKITGNKAIKYDDLKKVLKKMKIVVGNPFDYAKVHQIVVGLQQQYGLMGYRAVSVTADVKKTPHNTVAIYIKVHEGVIAKVGAINFKGNHVFSARDLRDQFQLTTPGILTIFNHKDRYSSIKLDQDLQSLQDYYLDHGYIKFHVTHKDIKYNADHTRVYITITVDEGPQYFISGWKVTGDLLGHRQALEKLITLKKGDVFSRQRVLATDSAINGYMANRGYAESQVLVGTQLDQAKHTVMLNFRVAPGGRIYVRRINFYGNQRTSEEVFRRELRQMEGAVYSASKIKQSTQNLKQLPYLDPYSLNMVTDPVPGSPDQVDLDYHLTEKNAGKVSIQAGYSDAYGFLYGSSITEPNFLGTGKGVGIGFQNNEVIQNYFLNYFDPYFTINGVSLGVNANYNHAKFDPRFNQQSYVEDTFGLSFNLGFPLNEHNTIQLGMGYNNTQISNVDTAIAAPSVLNFMNGRSSADFNIINVTGDWVYNSLDQIILPTRGWHDDFSTLVGVPVFDSSLSYYKVGNQVDGFIPLSDTGFVVHLTNAIGYGGGYGDQDRLPFFLNYYAGGLQGGLPGYTANSLGPKNIANSSASIGGNFMATAGVHLILPNFFHNHMRVAGTFDVGNVFQTPRFAGDLASPNIIQDESVSFKNLRMAAGVLITLYTPIAPIKLSLAFPIDKKTGDDIREFQFALSSGI